MVGASVIGGEVHNPFGQLIGRRSRPDFVVEPLAVAWDAVAFRVTGTREVIACVPRAELGDFLDRLERGALDDPIAAFVAQAPAGRVLRSASQTERTGLFDELATPDAIVPQERVPGRPSPLGRGGGGTPADDRRDKGQRRGRGRSPKRALLAVGGVVAVIAVAAVAVAASGGGDDTKVAAVQTTVSTTTAPTPTTSAPAVTAAQYLTGAWAVTRVVTASTNPIQGIGQTSDVVYTITSNCVGDTCTLRLAAPGSFGAFQQADLSFVGGHYEGAVTGVSPCTDQATGQHLSDSPITGTVSLTPVNPEQFIGALDLAIGESEGCTGLDRRTSFDLTGQRA